MTWLLRLALILPALTAAAEVSIVEFAKDGARYRASAVTRLDAPPEFVLATLLDFDNFHLISRGITITRWLDETHDGLPLAYTRIDSCVAFFCRTLEKVETVRVIAPASVETRTLPERSDFRVNDARWTLHAERGGTRIVYEVEMEPDFWVPPVIGPWAIRRKAVSATLEIGERIEALHASGKTLEDLRQSPDG